MSISGGGGILHEVRLLLCLRKLISLHKNVVLSSLSTHTHPFPSLLWSYSLECSKGCHPSSCLHICILSQLLFPITSMTHFLHLPPTNCYSLHQFLISATHFSTLIDTHSPFLFLYSVSHIHIVRKHP